MAAYSAEVLADSPLLFVKLDETSGATCANSGSLGGNATANGTFIRNISTGLAGLPIAIDLDGTSGNVTYPDTASLDITGDVTYECWFNSDGSTGWTLLTKGFTTGGLLAYQVRYGSGHTLEVLQNSTAFLLNTGLGTFADSVWNHIAFTRSGNSYKLYINGTNTDGSTASTTIFATNEAFTIGSNMVNGSGSNFFNGKMAAVAVYNTALSGARISAHYAARNTAGGGGGSTFIPQTIIIS